MVPYAKSLCLGSKFFCFFNNYTFSTLFCIKHYFSSLSLSSTTSPSTTSAFLRFVTASFRLFGRFRDSVFTQISAVLNGNALLFAGTLIRSRNVQDTVGVEFKSYFNLRYSAWC